MGGWVYMLTNRPGNILLPAFTRDLARRAWEHREGLVKGCPQRFWPERLVYAELLRGLSATRSSVRARERDAIPAPGRLV